MQVCAFDQFRVFWSRTAAGSLVRARARQMECKPVLSKFATGFQHAFGLLATRFSTRFAADQNNGMRPLSRERFVRKVNFEHGVKECIYLRLRKLLLTYLLACRQARSQDCQNEEAYAYRSSAPSPPFPILPFSCPPLLSPSPSLLSSSPSLHLRSRHP